MLHVKRFRCVNEGCSRVTFAERIPQIVPLHGQRTRRLTQKLRAMVFETSAEACSRQTRNLKMVVSGDTLLRIQRDTPITIEATPRVLGVDDWAFRKGVRYGTILVDLEENRPIDLLPDRRTETVKAWLSTHPGVEVVTRDRSNEYKAAISEALPHAIQVADRWHLMKNLGEALLSLLKGYTQELREVAQDLAGIAESKNEKIAEPITEPKPPTRTEIRFQEVKHLASEGLSQRQIAIQLSMSRRTVQKYLALETLPDYGPRADKDTVLTPFIPYLESRWQEGCHNARILTEEIQARGYQGSYGTVRRYLKPLHRKRRPSSDSLPPPVKVPSPRQAAWFLFLSSDQLEPEQLLFRQTLCDWLPSVALAFELAQRFKLMFHHHQQDAFDTWLADALASDIHPLVSFANGLLQDEAAVRAALTYPWSNGQVEGQINRLKTLKRMMYGRANFDLLRLRVLQPP